jgi:hypothetical protein
MKALGGCVMELDDCAFPLLTKVVQTDKLEARRPQRARPITSTLSSALVS